MAVHGPSFASSQSSSHSSLLFPSAMLPTSSSSPIDPQPSTYSKKAADLGLTKLRLLSPSFSSHSIRFPVVTNHPLKATDPTTFSSMNDPIHKSASFIKTAPILTSIPVIPSVPSTPSLSPKKRKASIVNLTISSDGRAIVETVPNPDLYSDHDAYDDHSDHDLQDHHHSEEDDHDNYHKDDDDDYDDDNDDNNSIDNPIESPDYTSDYITNTLHQVRRIPSITKGKGPLHNPSSRSSSLNLYQNPLRPKKKSNIDDAITALKHVIARNKSNGGIASPTTAGSLFGTSKPPKKKSCNTQKLPSKKEPKTPTSKTSHLTTNLVSNIPQTPQSIESTSSIKTPYTQNSISSRTNESSHTPLHLTTPKTNENCINFIHSSGPTGPGNPTNVRSSSSSASSNNSNNVNIWTNTTSSPFPLSNNPFISASSSINVQSQSELAAALAINTGLASPKQLAPEPEIRSFRAPENICPTNQLYPLDSVASNCTGNNQPQPLQNHSKPLDYSTTGAIPSNQHQQFLQLPFQPLQHGVTISSVPNIHSQLPPQPLHPLQHDLVKSNASNEHIYAFQMLPFHNQSLPSLSSSPMEIGSFDPRNSVPINVGSSSVHDSNALPPMNSVPLPAPMFVDINGMPIVDFSMDPFQTYYQNLEHQEQRFVQDTNHLPFPVEGIAIPSVPSFGDLGTKHDGNGSPTTFNGVSGMYHQHQILEHTIHTNPDSSVNPTENQQYITMNAQPVQAFHPQMNYQHNQHYPSQQQLPIAGPVLGLAASGNASHQLPTNPITIPAIVGDMSMIPSLPPPTEYPHGIPLSTSSSIHSDQHFQSNIQGTY